MDDRQYKALDEKIERITRLLTIIALKGEPSEKRKIELMDAMGFKASEVGKLLNKSPQNVSNVLRNLRKKEDEKTSSEVENQMDEQSQEQGTLMEHS